MIRRRPRVGGFTLIEVIGALLVFSAGLIMLLSITRDPEQTKPLLDSTESVLTALLASGVDAFPAYGTLLGAIREHDFIDDTRRKVIPYGVYDLAQNVNGR